MRYGPSALEGILSALGRKPYCHHEVRPTKPKSTVGPTKRGGGLLLTLPENNSRPEYRSPKGRVIKASFSSNSADGFLVVVAYLSCIGTAGLDGNEVDTTNLFLDTLSAVNPRSPILRDELDMFLVEGATARFGNAYRVASSARFEAPEQNL